MNEAKIRTLEERLVKLLHKLSYRHDPASEAELDLAKEVGPGKFERMRPVPFTEMPFGVPKLEETVKVLKGLLTEAEEILDELKKNGFEGAKRR